MFRFLRVPERLFAIAMWVVSLVFSGFLIGLGGKIVGELPGVDTTLSINDFVDPMRAAPLRAKRDSLLGENKRTQDLRDRAIQDHAAARNAYSAQQEQFNNWIATRTATTDPQQDPEVLARTRVLDSLKTVERSAESVVERLDATLLAISQAQESVREQEVELDLAARAPFERSRFQQELRTFGIRLALTLPLLLVAGWLVARKRKSEYWPLLRGFVLFAVFAFFVELVPYLPSYGGYVRYGVGILASAVVGVYIIRAMRRYLAQRQQVEQQSEAERRRAMPYEEAVKRIDGGVCPGCERAIAKGPNGPANFCVHCGLRLFDSCTTCTTKKNAFYPFCPQCGTSATHDTNATSSVSH
jgi:hypothetical protein